MTDWSVLAYFLWECPVCFAAVSRSSREGHEKWHNLTRMQERREDPRRRPIGSDPDDWGNYAI